jgi:hypothetical protein
LISTPFDQISTGIGSLGLMFKCAAAPQFALSYGHEGLASAGPTERCSSSAGRLKNLWSVWVLHENEEFYYAVV